MLLVLAALIGLSVASWCFLELVHGLQHQVYDELPDHLGFDGAPWWWPLPWLALAGLLTAYAVERLPGHGGHVPADGLKTGGSPTQPVLPGYAETPAVAGLVGATCVSVLRLPLSSVMIALLLAASAGLAVAPLVIVAYLVSVALSAYVDTRIGREEAR